MNNGLPPINVRRAALILGLSDLSLAPDGQWQACDRYDNCFTLSPQLIRSTLDRCAPESILDADNNRPVAEVNPQQDGKRAVA